MSGNQNWRNRDWGNTPVTDDNCDELRDRRISVLDHNTAGDPRKADAIERIPTTGDGPEKWLKSDSKWLKRFPAGWKGVKVLGAGGFGIAGHWKYVSDKAPEPGSVESQVRDIVVKQTRAAVGDGLRYESKFLEELTLTRSRHFPKLYGRVQRDVGTGTEHTIDPHRREVHRIFIEYCPGGSLASHMQNFKKTRLPDEKMPEAALWSIFHCLAKAVSVMDLGHEDDKRAAAVDKFSPWVENNGIVHFDLKPGNALVGSRDDGEHEVWDRVLVTDFGLSAYIPRTWNHDMKILTHHVSWGTPAFQAPEQIRRPASKKLQLKRLERKYGACTNIYQVGALMWALIVERPAFLFDCTADCYVSELTGKKNYQTIGEEIEDFNHYSKALRGLILECLFQIYEYRPTPSELIKRTRIGLSAAEGVGITASSRAAKASETSTIQKVDVLLLEQFHAPYRDHTWRKIIPRMQSVVNKRTKQLNQITTARLKFTAVEAAEAAKAAKDAQDARDAEAAEAAKIAADAKAAKDAQAAKDAVGTGPGRLRLPQGAAGDRVIGTPRPGMAFKLATTTGALFTGSRAHSLATNLAKAAGTIVEGAQPHVTNAVRNDLAPIAAAGWRVGMGVAGKLGLVQKRRSEEEAEREAAKRPRLGTFQGVQPPAAPQPGNPAFRVHVKIWPGAASSIANESRTVMKVVTVPANCTVGALKQLLADGGSVHGAPAARLKLVAKGDFAREMRDASPLSMFGLARAPADPAAPPEYIECFIKRVAAAPAPPASTGAFRLDLTVWPRTLEQRAHTVTLGLRHSTTMAQIKKTIVEAGIHGRGATVAELRIRIRGTVEGDEAYDAPDSAPISRFFSTEENMGAMECLFRSAARSGGSDDWVVTSFGPSVVGPRRP